MNHILFLCFLSLTLTSIARGQETISAPLDRAELLAEYKSNYFLLKNYYQNAKIVSEKTAKRFFKREEGKPVFLSKDASPIIDITAHLSYYSNGGEYFRLDSETFLHRELADILHRLKISISTPQKKYVLSKDEGAKFYSLDSEEDTTAPDDSEAASSAFPFLPLSVDGVKNEYFLFPEPDSSLKIQIHDLSSNTDEGETIVSVSFTAVDAEKNTTHYQLKFFREHHWVLKEATVEMGEYIKRISIDYQHFKPDQIPHIKSCLIEQSTSEGKIIRTEEFEITQMIPGPVPLAEFEVLPFLYRSR